MKRAILTDAEMIGVSKTSADKQYAYWLRNVVEWRDIWVLEGKVGWYMYKGPTGTECVCVWPHNRYASWYLENIEPSQTLHPVSMPFSVFLGDFLPSMNKDGRKIAIGPFLGTKAVLKEPTDVLKDITHEMSFRV